MKGGAKVSTGLKNALTAIRESAAMRLQRTLLEDPELALDPRLLSEAALFGAADCVEFLLEQGADPDERVPSHENFRPLHRAIEHRGVRKNPGHICVVKLLLEAGASLKERSLWTQLTPLAVAGKAGDAEMAAVLKEAGADLDIFTACILVDQGALDEILQATPALARARDENRMTPLHYLALTGFHGDQATNAKLAGMTRHLLEAGAEADAREPIGPYPPTAPLHFAAYGNPAVAQALLEHGADPNGGFATALWHSIGPLQELFLKHGADVNMREADGKPLLHIRIQWNLPKIALWLLKNGADPNLTDSQGNNALHIAARRGINPTVVQALLDAGADPAARNAEGHTPLEIAKAKRRGKIQQLLE